MSFNGQSIAITGASSGLGLHLAREFSAQGARVAMMARDEARLKKSGTECDGDPLLFAGDVTSENDCKIFIEKVTAEFGGLDHLIANAGQSMWAQFEDVEDLIADLDQALEKVGAFVNLCEENSLLLVALPGLTWGRSACPLQVIGPFPSDDRKLDCTLSVCRVSRNGPQRLNGLKKGLGGRLEKGVEWSWEKRLEQGTFFLVHSAGVP